MRARGTNLLIMGLLLFSVLVLSLPTVSSPTDNRLAALVESSDLVAVADIVDVSDAPTTRFDPFAPGHARVAQLSMIHVWKGEPAGTINVPFEDCVSSPSGPAYVQGDRVVVFLRNNPEGWTTVDLAKVPDDATSALESLDLSLLGHGPGATCLPGLPIQR